MREPEPREDERQQLRPAAPVAPETAPKTAPETAPETAKHPVPGIEHEPEPDAENLIPAEDRPGTL